MRKVFNYDGPFLTIMTRVADLFWLNLLYIVCCIPIITIGAANTALYYVTLKMARDEESHITKSFFSSFIRNLRQAVGIWLIFLIIIVVLFADLFIAANGNLSAMVNFEAMNDVILIAVGVMALLITFILQYVFAILAQFDNTIFNTIKNSFLISVRHLPYTILFIVIYLLPYAFIYVCFMYGGEAGGGMSFFLIFFMYSLVAYIKSKQFNKIFALYMPKEEESEEDSSEKIFSN